MSFAERVLLLLSLYAWLVAAVMVPTFESVSNWQSIGSLVPGMTALEAVGPNWREKGKSAQSFTIDTGMGDYNAVVTPLVLLIHTKFQASLAMLPSALAESRLCFTYTTTSCGTITTRRQFCP